MRRLNQFKRTTSGGIAVAAVAVGAFALWTFAQDSLNSTPFTNEAAPAPVSIAPIGSVPAEAVPAPINSESLPATQEPAAEAVTPPALTGDATLAEGEVIPLRANDAAGIETVEGQNLINVTVENETLENVVNMFARISGANIVTTSADLGGTVTVNLRAVEWKPALSSILDIHNLALIEKLPGSGVYTIIPKPSADTEPLAVQTIFLNFTTVPEMAPLVRSMLSTVSNAAVSEFPSRNAMVIKTTEPNMLEIQTLVHQMDVPGRQVVVETKFMELSDSASKKLGIRWDSLDEYRVGLTPGPFTYDRTVDRTASRANTTSQSSESTTKTGEHRQSDLSGQAYEEVESVTFIQSPDSTPENPIFTTLEVIQPTKESDTTTSKEDSESHTTGDTYNKAVSEGQAAILDFATFNAVISALQKTEGVSVISNPKIIVASGSKDAYFTVGEREPIIKTETQRGTQDSPGDVITATLDTTINTEYIKEGYLETGIHLQVTPVVKTDDLIEAMIEPKLIRRVLPDKVVGENSWPRIAVKEIKTTFTLRSGQTVAIGGLTDSSDDVQITKIPFLGDIPLIGKYLFSHKSDVKRQVETIIFVTLTMAEAEGLYREAGIPEDGRLVHKQLIKNEDKRERLENELEDLRKAADIESAERARARLLKHGK